MLFRSREGEGGNGEKIFEWSRYHLSIFCSFIFTLYKPRDKPCKAENILEDSGRVSIVLWMSNSVRTGDADHCV